MKNMGSVRKAKGKRKEMRKRKNKWMQRLAMGKVKESQKGR